MVKVPRPAAKEKKPGIAARATVEYFILATVDLMRLKNVLVELVIKVGLMIVDWYSMMMMMIMMMLKTTCT